VKLWAPRYFQYYACLGVLDEDTRILSLGLFCTCHGLPPRRGKSHRPFSSIPWRIVIFLRVAPLRRTPGLSIICTPCISDSTLLSYDIRIFSSVQHFDCQPLTPSPFDLATHDTPFNRDLVRNAWCRITNSSLLSSTTCTDTT
jgi:hypothetical protein